MDRRRFATLVALGLAGAWRGAAARDADTLERFCAALERTLGGRVGVAVHDGRSGRSHGHRADERFPLCSSFKWLAAAAVLARVDRGQEDLGRTFRIDPAAILEWAPVAKENAGRDMTLAALCDASITVSDNTAANILLDVLGGPAALTAFLRMAGDPVTRLDRPEPAMNESIPGDLRDTTTPAAMVGDLRRILLGDVLSAASRERLQGWMLASKTSDARLRHGLPAGWRLADKTGTGPLAQGVANDAGIYRTPDGTPVAVAVYLAGAAPDRSRQERAIAEIGALVRAGTPG